MSTDGLLGQLVSFRLTQGAVRNVLHACTRSTALPSHRVSQELSVGGVRRGLTSTGGKGISDDNVTPVQVQAHVPKEGTHLLSCRDSGHLINHITSTTGKSTDCLRLR